MFVSHKAKISGKFDSRTDSHPTKLEGRPRILVKLSFRGFCDLKLSNTYTFDNIAISSSLNRSENQKSRLPVHVTSILEIFL